MLKIENKFLYLVTFGGLNDTLNQIMFAYEYCLSNKRLLVINTLHSRLERDIQEYFDMENNVIYKNSLQKFIYLSKTLTKFPNFDLDGLSISFDFKQKKILYNNQIFNVDLKTKYCENIIVYGNQGLSGLKTKNFFELFNIKKDIIDTLKKRHESLPKNYISVHIRNTDYKSNVPDFVEKYKSIFKNKNIFLATDNKDSQNYFIRNTQANIFTFTNLPEYDVNVANGIHKCKTINKDQVNKDSIIDLILLSLGNKIYVSCEKSGFSKNAISMQKSMKYKKRILSQLK